MKLKPFKGHLNPVILALTLEAMADKFPLKIVAESTGKKAEIKITGAIYEWSEQASTVTTKIDDFLKEGINDVDVYINCPGGDVFAAAEISNQLQRFPGKKRGFGGALVASAATMIAIDLDSFELAENGQWMYHKPSAQLSGNEDKIAGDLKLLQNLTIQYREKYAAKIGITADELELTWSKGDVWLTSAEALEKKFITGVSKKTVVTPENTDMVEAITARNREQSTSKKMADKDIDACITELIFSKKITALQITATKNMFRQNPENAFSFFALKPALPQLSKLIGETNNNPKSRTAWTLDQWRQNDPQELRRNPALYAELVEKSRTNNK